MIPELADFESIIEELSILEHLQRDDISVLRLKIVLNDEPVLIVNEIQVHFMNKRKYSYHWQTKNNNLISRWDNAPHYQNLSTFPFHQHFTTENNVIESKEMNLRGVLQYITTQITNNN